MERHRGHREQPRTPALLNNLGEVYRAEARLHACRGALSARRWRSATRVLGEDGYFIATALQNLGIVARERKDYAAAEAYYARALSIRERIVGPDHPDVAQVLNNLAIIYRAKGDIEKSLQTHLRALSIWEHAAGPYQQATLLSVGNIAQDVRGGRRHRPTPSRTSAGPTRSSRSSWRSTWRSDRNGRSCCS